MKSSKDPRHKSRMRLVETMYASRVNPDTEDLPDNIYSYDKELFSKISDVISANKQATEELIEEVAQRKVEDIKNIEFVILSISLAEGYFSEITPYKVAIDEGIELSREYGDEASALFVSGVLGAAFDKKYKKEEIN